MERSYYFLIVDIDKDTHKTIVVDGEVNALQVMKEYDLIGCENNGISNNGKYSFAIICN